MSDVPNPQRILHIRSQDCTKIEGTWSVILPENIAVNSDEEISVEIINASIPYSFYNVNYANKYLSIREEEIGGANPVDWTLTLTEGNYNAITFLSAFQTAINSQSTSLGKGFTYTTTYNKLTNTATIALTSPNSQTNFLFRTGAQERFDCQYLLGFTFEDFQFTTSSSLTSDASMNMSPYDSVYVYSNLGIVNAYDTKTRNLTNILVKVPIISLPFSYIQWENTQNLSYKSNRSLINEIQIQMKDFDGDDIDLRNANWYMSIKFIITKKSNVFTVSRPNELVPVEMEF